MTIVKLLVQLKQIKTIEKLPENTLAYFKRICESPAYNYEHLYKKVLNKINELVDAVNKLNGERYE